jgi:predicted nucleotidyltransferase
MISQTTLIGYALSFTSFLLDSKIGNKINKVILFGSVARNDYGASSDIDLFIDTDENLEKEINKLLILYKSSQVYQSWKLKGIKNDISVKVGRLKEWSLRREVLSSGIILYGKYNELPEKTEYLALIKVESGKVSSAKQMRLWRQLYGYKQKVGKKVYSTTGLLEESGGKKLGKAVFLIPMENRFNVLAFLKKNRINYTINELWSDTF